MREERRALARLRRIAGDLEICQEPTRPRGVVGATAKKPKCFRLHPQPSTSPRRRANQQRALRGLQSAFDSTSASFHRFSSYYIMQVGEKLETFALMRGKINAHTNPPLFGLSHWKSTGRNYYFWKRLLLFLFWFSLLRLLPGDGRGWRCGGAGR